MGKLWYYAKNGQEFGPFTVDEMREMLESRVICYETLARNESLSTWNHIFNSLELQGFLTQGLRDNLLFLQPWVRMMARLYDYLIFIFVGFLLSLTIDIEISINSWIYLSKSFKGFSLFCVMVTYLWILVESLLLSTWGTTPGRLLLKIKLRDKKGCKPRFFNALIRSFTVWWKGMALGIPLFFFITLWLSYQKIRKNGTTSWDLEGVFKITFGNTGKKHVALYLLSIISLIFIQLQLILNWNQLKNFLP